MIEDKSFNNFLKAKLEESFEVPELKLNCTRRISAVRYLRAASLAAICAVGASLYFCGRVDAGEKHAFAAIEFLSELDVSCADVASESSDGESSVDTLESSYHGDSLAQTLLAWQDAPYNELELIDTSTL